MKTAILPPRPVTPGAYDGTIVEASLQAFDWAGTPANPEGVTLRVAVELTDELGVAHCCDGIRIDNVERLASLFRSVGLLFDGDIGDIQDLVGRRCRLTVKNIEPRQGRHAGRLKGAVAAWISRGGSR